MLLVTSAVKTVLSISQNGICPNTLNKELDNHLNMDIMNVYSCKTSLLLLVMTVAEVLVESR